MKIKILKKRWFWQKKSYEPIIVKKITEGKKIFLN